MESSRNEKGAIAHSWVIVNDDSTTTITTEQTLKDFFVQFYFQCVLSTNVVELEKKFELLLLEAHDIKNHSKIDFIQYIIKICLQNRDIKHGKGLTQTTYMMLNTIAYYCYEKEILPRNTLLKMLSSFVINKHDKKNNKFEHPYGSWKDIKYFLDYFWKNSSYDYINTSKSSIIDEVIKNIYIPQMITDRKNMSVKMPISLCGKWLPRESGQDKLLARKIAVHYHNEVYKFSEKVVKIYQNYRKLVSKYNAYLDTTQIHMTGKAWDKINFENVTSKTLFLNKNSFLNCNNIDEDHRHICKQNFLNFISNKKKNGNYLKNDNTVMPHILVRNVFKNYNDYHENNSMALLNMQWNGLMKTLETGNFMRGSNCFPCIDVSPSMMTDNSTPLHCAIGLGLACAHLCKHNRAFTFSSNPEWIQYDQTETFVDRVYKTRGSGWGSTTNIHKMFRRILDACLTSTEQHEQVPQSEIDNTCLIVFSDMQFDCNETNKDEKMFDDIRREYKDAGYTNIPFLVFWNLRSTDTFPSIEKSENMIQLSGNSSCLLEIFMKTELKDLKTLENWDILKQILDNQRYII